jgi:hypothetical protein
MNDNWLSVVYLLGALVLVSSNFWGRQFALGAMVRMALLWLGIFLFAYLIADNWSAIGRAIGLEPPEEEQSTPIDRSIA